MMVKSGQVLIVDDDSTMCELLDISLASQGYEIATANDGFHALELLEAGQFNVAILDLMLPGLNGIEILERIHERQIETEVVMLTAHASLKTAIEALRLGAYDYITKPFQIDVLRSTVRRALEKQRLETRLAAIYDLSREMALLLDVEQVAETMLDIIERVLTFDICGLGLVDEERDELDWLAVHGVEQKAIPRILLNDDKGIIAAAIRSREPLYVPDTRDDPRYVGAQAASGSELVVPLKVRGRVIGVLNVESAEVDGFSQGDVRLLSTLASQTAVVIENARLYGQAQQEIAERRWAEEEIKRRRDHYRAVVNGLHDQVVIIDRDYRISDANEVFLRQMGCTREEIVGQYCYEVIYQCDERCDTNVRSCPMRPVWETGRPARATHVRHSPDGKNDRWFDVAASPLLDAKGQVTQVIAAYRDLTAERRLEKRLTGVHALGRELVLSREERQIAQITADAAVFLLQSQLCELWLVDEKEKMLIPQAYAGRTESMNLYPLPLDDEESIVAAVARGGEPIYEPYAQKEPRYTSMGRKNRALLCMPLEVTGKIIGVLSVESDRPDAIDEIDMKLLSVLADYSALALDNARLYEAEREQRRMVEQSQAHLVLSEKLAATGRLAASLAHEINNPLQAIHNSLQLMLSFQLKSEEQQEYLQIASEEVERLIGLVTRMLNFARRPRREMRPINLNAVVEKVLALTSKYLQHHHVTLQRDMSSDLPTVLGNADELKQVFLNIVLNGVDAMPEGGTLCVTSRADEDGRLAVIISDTGHGIPSEYLDSIFEPFFSTQDTGSGLGLSISHNLIERHGGEIAVQSVEGEGTTFTVWLPAMQE